MDLEPNRWQTFIQEVKRRKVFQVILAYIAFAWLSIQVATVIADTFTIPSWVLKATFIILLVGLPIIAILAWIFDIKHGGIVRTKELPHPTLLDVSAIPIIFHASIDNTLDNEQRHARFRDYVVWAKDFNVDTYNIYQSDYMVLFDNSVDALRYAIRIQNHSQQLDLPLKISVIEAREDKSQQDEKNEIARARALAVDSKVGSIVITNRVREAIKDRGLKEVEKALQLSKNSNSKIEQQKYSIKPNSIKAVNQALKDYSNNILYPTAPTSLKLASLLFLTVIAAGLWRFIPTLEVTNESTISILPFKNISSNSEEDDFVSGLSDDIFHNISQIPSINIVSRRSSQSFQNNTLSIQEIGEFLNADLVLEGNINKNADSIKVSLWITDTKTSLEQWNQVFYLNSSELFIGNKKITQSLSKFLGNPTQEIKLAQAPINPNNNSYPEYLRAKGLLKKPPTMTRLGEIESIYNNILSEQHDFTPAIAGLCRTYLLMYALQKETHQFNKAEQQCLSAHKGQDTNIDILTTLIQLNLEKGNLDDAEKFIEIAQQINPSNIDLLFNQAEFKKVQGDYAQAIQYLEQAIQLEPGYWRLFQMLGSIYLYTGKWQLASEQFEKVIQLIPNDSHGYTNLGTAYFFQGEFDKAAKVYEQSLNYQRDDVALSNIATMWFYHGDYAKASNYYLQAIQLAPKHYIYWLNLADAEAQGEQGTSQALVHYQHALDLALETISINKNDADARIAAAWSHAQLNQTMQALAQLNEAIRIKNNDPNLLFLAAKIMAKTGDMAQGNLYLKQAISSGFPEKIVKVSPIISSLNLSYQ